MNKTNSPRADYMERFRGYFQREWAGSNPDDDAPPRRTMAIIVCVIISGTLWLTFTMQETHEMVLPLEVQLENMPSDRMLADSLPRSIRVTVEAQRIQLLRLMWDPPTVPINVSSNRIVVEDVIPPLGNVRVQGVSPTVIEPRLEQQVRRRIPIRLRHRITTPPSHDFLEPPTIEPDSVTVTGARSIIEDLRYWPTEVFTEEELEDTLVAHVPLADTLRGLVRTNPSEVILTATVGEFIGAIREIDVHARGVPSTGQQEIVLDPSTIRVRYRVLFSQYDQAQNAPDFYAEVSYEQIRANPNGRVRPELNLPENLEIRDAEMIPATVAYYDVVENR